MKDFLSWLSLLLVLLSGCAATADPPVYSTLPEFTLTERSNRPVSREDLADTVWIADFIFTQCAGICPKMSTNMQTLQNTLPSAIRLVSFSVDPKNDTPEVLSAYADRYGADRDRWLFLTGDEKTLHRLSIEGFKLAVDNAGTEVEPITHSSRLVLIDRKGQVRGYYGTEDEGALDRLIEDAKKLL